MRSFLLALVAPVALLSVACADAPTDSNPATGANPTCSATPYAQGCAAKKVDAPKSEEVPVTVTQGTQGTANTTEADQVCKAKTCEDFGGACGDHDDGCGKKFSCGACKPVDPSCKKKTCDDLSVSCGTHDDGCGGTVSCGTCATACATDAHEPNDTSAQAGDLGATADTDDKVFTISNLDSSDGDEDWFKIAVADKGWNGNPVIDVTSTDEKLEVAAFHACISLPNYSYCYYDGTQTNVEGLGNGCAAAGHVTLKTDCKGIDESGETYVRVRKTSNDLSCHSYDLKIEVY
jgi:hypothetical protein